jgi:hypothetical protein
VLVFGMKVNDLVKEGVSGYPTVTCWLHTRELSPRKVGHFTNSNTAA